MNVAKLRRGVAAWLLCAVAACGVWEDVRAAQRRATRGESAATRRARRQSAARRARARNVRRPAAATAPRGGVPLDPVLLPPINDGPRAGQAPAQKWKIVEGGTINSKAISAPPPEYPPIARAARAQGRVVVRIILDEEGRVISAQAVSGHPLLRQSAVETVLQWRFTPTMLSGQPVRVTGRVTVDYSLR